jgi:hypothetical protein
MPKQITFASLAHASKKKVTRREKFLAEMEVVVPWSRLLALIERPDPKMGGKGVRAWASRIAPLAKTMRFNQGPLGVVNHKTVAQHSHLPFSEGVNQNLSQM